MSFVPNVRQWRDWFPVPTGGWNVGIYRWVMLEANRLALTGALLTFVFTAFVGLSMLWTFEMQNLLTETETVETILNTFLSGMILLVSIVVSINSIVLSHDMSSVDNQQKRVEGAAEFRRLIGELSEDAEELSDPTSFLGVMSRTIRERARRLTDDVGGADGDTPDEILNHSIAVAEATDQLEVAGDTTGADFAVLWKGMEFQYGTHLERARRLKSAYESSEPVAEELDSLIEALQLFAVGREYFKTMYYTQEVSKLSHTLLVVTLPAILINATTILAINAGVLPDFWFLGLPPLQTFVAATFTVSLAPYLVLTSYILRLSAVARLTSSAGIFTLS